MSKFNLQTNEKIALFALCAMHCPIEPLPFLPSTSNDKRDTSETIWSFRILEQLTTILSISPDYIHAYRPVVSSSFSNYTIDEIKGLQQSIQPFLKIIKDSNLNLCHLVIYLKRIKIEVQLANYVIQHKKKLIEHLYQKKNDTKTKMIRYAKVGLVGLGAGTLLALSGGIAAPAIAGALLVMGAPATAVSVGTMALLFGTTGAGLASYKMLKRTEDLQEFEFEQCDQNGQLAVMIMVSGWVHSDDADDDQAYKKPFGIIPENTSNMPLVEKLYRFYKLHCPEKLAIVEKEVEYWSKEPDELLSLIMDSTGLDPTAVDSLRPPYPIPPYDEEYNFLMEDFAEMHRSSLSNANSRNVSTDDASEIVSSLTSYQTKANTSAKSTHVTSSKSYQSSNEMKSETVVNDGGWKLFHDEQEPVNISSSTAALLTDDTVAPTQSNEKLKPSNGAMADQYTSFGSIGNGVEFDQSTSYAIDEPIPVQATEIPGIQRYWHWREMQSLCPIYELYVLKWDVKTQQSLGLSILELQRYITSNAVQEVIGATLLSALSAAIMMPGLLLKFTDLIDNIWFIASKKADVAGRELAKALLLRSHGSRPVTLVGYSMGCRVIFHCLLELSKLLFNESLPTLNAVATPAMDNQSFNTSLSSVDVDAAVSHENYHELSQLVIASSQPPSNTSDDFFDERDDSEDTVATEDEYIESNEYETKKNFLESTRSTVSTIRPGFLIRSIIKASSSSTTSSSTTTTPAVPGMRGQSGNIEDLKEDHKVFGGGNTRSVTSPDLLTEVIEAYISSGREIDDDDPRSRLNHLSKEEKVKRMLLNGLNELIQDVVLAGAPLNSKSQHWMNIRKLVAGRLINCYSTKDFSLGIIYKVRNIKMNVAGVMPIDGVPGIENFDLSGMVTMHSDYCGKMKEILEFLQLNQPGQFYQSI